MPVTIPLKTSPEVIAAFEKSYHVIAEDLLHDLEHKYKMPAVGVQRMRQMLEHNVMGGKMNRGLAVVDTLMIIAQAQGKTLTEDDIFRAHVAGWAIEWLQACFLVADDIMDQSHTRRGKPCWYRMPGVGLEAVNDALVLEGHIFMFIKKHFRSQPYYADLVDLLHEVAYLTELGQMIDMLTAPEGDVNLSRFSLDRHAYIVVHKTSYYSFYLSVAMAFMLSGITNPAAFDQAKQILLPLGEYFQVQDDYLDAFADPSVLGKIGTDIEDNKCSWLVNTALARCTPEQRTLLDTNYGRKDAKCIEAVKQLYRDMQLDQEFERYEEASYKRIMGMINGIDKGLGVPPEVYVSFMNKIYKRSK
ncbi:geranyltranstransferase [Catenaria anguillulae PL171]|uniref:Geranyltranstransferase n=1 Tax=Catenaria anguillulae PL171 TaxID=765915 RepID=A0A1Y2HMF7_9FUNG|nr:geranyltranstransferase [Catenaria anguillulae PL171]